jgi:predicted ArsR family transcriptional regulator
VQPTSLDAWDSRDRQSDRLMILRIIIDSGPITLDAVAERLKRTPNSISGRFTELKADASIERLSQRRQTRSGATAFLWIATAKGMETLGTRETKDG